MMMERQHKRDMMKKILIIEDDTQIGNLEQEVLEQQGYACLRAYSGTEAVMLLERERPDLILLDLMLPGLSGEEVLKKIGDTPVIVVSAKAGVDDKVALLLGDAQDYSPGFVTLCAHLLCLIYFLADRHLISAYSH